jgi:hypothetical protein
MSTRRYQREYGKLGEERLQNFPQGLSEAREVVGRNGVVADGGGAPSSEFDRYWNIRIDVQWVAVPGKRQFIRKLRVVKFLETLPSIIMSLQPANTFNPYSVWKEEREKEAAELAANDEDSTATVKAVKVTKLSSKDVIKNANIASLAKKERVLEITRIRNTEKDNLVNIIRDIHTKDARAVLLVEILDHAYKIYMNGMKSGRSDKTLLYEALWAIDMFAPLPEMNAPMPKKGDLLGSSSKSMLKYDQYADVEELLKRSNKIRAKDTHEQLTKLQVRARGLGVEPHRLAP